MRVTLLFVLALAACTASGPPLVDMTDVNPVSYQHDFDRCAAETGGSDKAGPIIAGAIIGLSIGAGAGALATGGPALLGTSDQMAIGAGAGAAAGATVGAIAGAPPAPIPAPQKRTMEQCLEAAGYRVVGHAQYQVRLP